MPDPDFISYLKTLKPEDWNKMVTSKWTVKDVVAHMVGGEKGDVEALKKCWETKTPPWWKIQNDDDAFNAKAVEFYKNSTREKLVAEWERWQRKVQEEIGRIGKKNLKTRKDLFEWLFEGGEDDRGGENASHYKHHYIQIKKAL